MSRADLHELTFFISLLHLLVTLIVIRFPVLLIRHYPAISAVLQHNKASVDAAHATVMQITMQHQIGIPIRVKA